MGKKVFEVAGMKATVELSQDDFAENPVDSGRLGKLLTFYDKSAFWNAVENEFGSLEAAQQYVLRLVEGELLPLNGKIYYGIEKYEHGGVSYAVCKQGNFPDRQWDVSPIVGFGCVDVSSDPDVVAGFVDSGVSRNKVLQRLSDHLEEYTQWASGDVWCYSASLEKDGKEVFSDTLGGIFGYDEAMSQAKLILEEKAAELSAPPSRKSRRKMP